MKVSVIINPFAGSVKMDLVERKISDALFRCQLFFHFCGERSDLDSFVKSQIKIGTDAFLICGGDGTINTVLQSMVVNKPKNKDLPPICLVSSGTANDLANSMDITTRIDRAARLLLEGQERKIDLIEVEANNEKKYMLTNGGIGIPAIAADKANILRNFLNKTAENKNLPAWGKKLTQVAQSTVKKAGKLIYSTTLLETIQNWDSKDWDLEINIPNKDAFNTSAPFLMVNNQPMIGQTFLTAPYTAQNDGNVNLLLIESKNKLIQLEKVARVVLGNLRESKNVKSFEIPEFTVKSKSKKQKMTFFGDGEILFRNVEEIKVRCLKRNVSIMVKE